MQPRFAAAATALTGLQIIFYDRGGQTVSRTCILVLILLGLAIFVAAGLVAGKVAPSFSWLNYLLYLSYIKLAISLMKYIPQAVLNCRRKSTQGWT